jgi:hypothetical protein
MKTDRPHGFTMVEAVALVAAAGVLSSLGLLGFGQQPDAARDRARQLKDSTQARGIHQAFVVWAQNNNDQYPLPSAVDKENRTVKAEGKAKDTTANIMSLLVYCGSVGTEMLVSPAEKNPAVKAYESYSFDRPKKAAQPKRALWDPTLKASLGPDEGHISYAHLQPCAGRLEKWTNTFNASEAIIASRGPEIASVAHAPDDAERPEGHARPVVPTFAKADSLTLSMLGDGTAWTGHIVFNDNHVELQKKMLASGKQYSHKDLLYRDAAGKKRSDVIFFDEADDPAGKNHYIGIFTGAGDTPAQYKAIWD